MPKKVSFERTLLRDADVKFGYDHYELLQHIGRLVRKLRDDCGASELGSVADSDVRGIEAAGLDDGPPVLTLVRLAHAAGRRLVIGLEDTDGEERKLQILARL